MPLKASACTSGQKENSANASSGPWHQIAPAISKKSELGQRWDYKRAEGTAVSRHGAWRRHASGHVSWTPHTSQKLLQCRDFPLSPSSGLSTCCPARTWWVVAMRAGWHLLTVLCLPWPFKLDFTNGNSR